MLRSLVLGVLIFYLMLNPSNAEGECTRCTAKDLNSLIEASEETISKTIEDTYKKEFKNPSKVEKSILNGNSRGVNFYIFVSFSMPIQGLIDLGKQASLYGAVLVLRGLKENSYTKTAFYLKEFIEKTGSGMIIDPELFKKFDIKTVPTFVVAEVDPLSSDGIKTFDSLQGYITVKKALELMVEKGDLYIEADKILNKEMIKNAHSSFLLS